MKPRTIIPLLLAAATAAVLSAGCSDEEAQPRDEGSAPVSFTARVQTAQPAAAPQTRTVLDPDGNTLWTRDDEVGVLMLTAGGTVGGDVVPGAENIAHLVDPHSGELSPTHGTPIYYPRNQAVDFVAYYPFHPDSKLVDPPLGDQTTIKQQAAIDYLFSDNAKNVSSGEKNVELEFRHLMSKIRFDITLGSGVAGDEITKAELHGINTSLTVFLWEGRIAAGTGTYPIELRKSSEPTAGAGATFTALVPPGSGDNGCSIVIKVDGNRYIGTIADSRQFQPNTMYIYPVTVQGTAVSVGTATIEPWEEFDPVQGEV